MCNVGHKTTDEHYELFCSEVNYWIKTFGLMDWRVMLQHDEQPNNEYLAMTSYNFHAHMAIINLAANFDIPPTHMEICRTAFHESVHLLFADLMENAKKSEEIEHGLIRTFENTLFRDNYYSRYTTKGKPRKQR